MLKQFFLALMLLIALPVAHAEDQECAITPASHLGNNYKANVATLTTSMGKGLVINGRVLAAKSCSPIEDAIIEIWSAGNDGKYHDRLRAYALTLPDGSFEFETEWPNISPPHVHFIVTAGGYSKLVTQWVPDEKVDRVDLDLILRPMLMF